MSEDVHDFDDVIVTISHSYGDFEAPLTQWIETGPGPRFLTHPVAARSASTGEELPLTVIPIRYRNDEESRHLIAMGVLEYPWGDEQPTGMPRSKS